MMGMMVFGTALVMASSPSALARARLPATMPPGAGAFQLLSVVEYVAVHLPDSELLEEIGLTLYERKALVTLMVFGVADAAAICREGAVPTSKIYRAMEKLAQLGLVQMQPTRPRMYAALPPEAVADRVAELV